MKMAYDGQLVTLSAENAHEKVLLDNPYTQSKLAFTQAHVTSGAVQLIFSAKEWAFHWEHGAIHIPLSVNQLQEVVFALRIIVDYYLIENNCVPLHAALMKTKQNQALFLCGDTNCGKSSIGSLLQKSGYTLLGDDHVAAGELTFYGNTTCRLRDARVQYEALTEHKMASAPYTIIEVNISKEENVTTIPHTQYKAKPHTHILKYLLLSQKSRAFGEQPLVAPAIIQTYEALFKQFIEGATSIVSIEGSPQFITQTIFELEKNGDR